METYKFNWIGFTKWHVGIAHPHESKQNIFSIELARRLKPRRGMEFHSAPQIKSVNLAVFKDGKVYTFYLRRGVKFHTTPWFKPTREFNAEDVLFTFVR